MHALDISNYYYYSEQRGTSTASVQLGVPTKSLLNGRRKQSNIALGTFHSTHLPLRSVATTDTYFTQTASSLITIAATRCRCLRGIDSKLLIEDGISLACYAATYLSRVGHTSAGT